MNDKFMELAEQAGFEHGHQDRNGNSLSYELEKFAELIIEECFSQIYDRGKYSDGDWTKYKIRKHFGLKK